MEVEISVFGSLFFVALIIATLIVKRRSDVLYGPFIERGFDKRVAVIAAL